MKNLGNFKREARLVFQQDHMPRKWVKIEQLEEVMNPSPSFDASSTKPKKVIKSLTLYI